MMRTLYKYILYIFLATALSGCFASTNVTQKVEKVDEGYKHKESEDILEIVEEETPVVAEKLKTEVRVAFLAPLSGENALIGRHMMDATQLAMFDLGANNIHLVPIDTAQGADGVISKMDSEDFDLILGPVFSNNTRAIYPYAKQNKICMISFSNDEDLSGRDCLFLLGFMPQQQIDRVVKYAASQGFSSLYSVLPKNRFGNMIEEEVNRSARDSNFSIKRIEKYFPAKGGIMRDLNQAVLNIRQDIEGDDNYGYMVDDENAVLIPEGGSRLRKILKQFKLLQSDDMKYKLLGSSQWEDKKIYSIPELRGSWFASAPKKARENFEKRFEQNFDYRPFKITTLAYDSVALVAVLAKNGLDRKNFSKNAITNPNGFKGITGIFRFRKNGTNQRALSVFQITKNNIEEVDPAPETFMTKFW